MCIEVFRGRLAHLTAWMEPQRFVDRFARRREATGCYDLPFEQQSTI